MDISEGSAALAYLSGFTLLLLPATGSDELRVTTVIKDRTGQTLGEYRSREKVTLWMQALLILGMPFASHGSVVTQAFKDLHLDTLHAARSANAI